MTAQNASTVTTTNNTNNNYPHNNPPSCEFKGPEIVCPGTSNQYYAKTENLPYGYTFKWSVLGDGYIVGDNNKKYVTIKAKTECNTKYKVKLSIEKKGYGYSAPSGTNGGHGDYGDDDCSKIVWVKSASKPYIQCPNDITVQCYKDVPSADPYSVKAWNDCGGDVKVTFEGDKIISNHYQPCVKTIIRCYKATDICGNSSYCYQKITVDDKTPPTIECPKDITVQCEKDIPVYDCTPIKAWDNCGGYVKVTFDGDKKVTEGCIITITRCYKATDICGNSSYCYQKITVNDKTPPTIECPKDITVQCEKDIPVYDCTPIKAWDNCGGYVKVTFDGDKKVTEGCIITITRCYKATDICGNSSYCYQKITVNDKTPPTIECPKDITVECKDVPSADPSSVKTWDNCGGYVKVTFEGDKVVTDPNNKCLTIITRCYKATDICGNSSYCYQKITVNDKTPPTITCPKDITVECEKDVPAYDCSSVKVTDNCSGTVKVTFEGDKVVKDKCLITITRCYKATDACGNAAYCYQKITVNDKTPPTITCPKDITVACGKGVPDADCATVKTSDNCGGTVKVTFEGDKVVKSTSTSKTISRCYKATDACGNSSYCYQTITVNLKGAPPTITCPKDITVQCEKNVPKPDVASVKVTGSAKVTFEGDKVETNSSNKCLKIITRCYKATDGCGNSAKCYQTITVNDKTPPSITCPKDITVKSDKDVPKYDCATVKASDNCGGSVKVTYEGDKELLNKDKTVKVITRGYKATDNCGNWAICYQTITVKYSSQCSCPTSARGANSKTDKQILTDETSIVAYPNPYTDQVSFKIVSPVSGNAVLEVYNYVGQKLGIAYNGAVFARVAKTVNYAVPMAHRVPLMYRLTIGDVHFTGSVIPQK